MDLISRIQTKCTCTSCDDQQELNHVLASHEMQMAWSVEPDGRDGVSSAASGLRVHVWPRSFAWRGTVGRDPCPDPAPLWVACPLASKDIAAKAAVLEQWDEACGH